MPRSIINKQSADLLSDGIVANIQQAIYQDNATTFLVMRAEASQKFIAIPPVVNPLNTAISSNHLLLAGMPQAVEIYRDEEYYIAFNSSVFSNTGAWIPGGVLKYIPLNPGLAGNTLAVVAITGTSPLRANWIQL